MGLTLRHWDETGGVEITAKSWTSIKAGKESDRAGTAQAGGTATITLDTGASSEDNHYLNFVVAITAGTGSGQWRTVTAYVGSTRVATVDTNWAVVPDATSVFRIFLAEKFFVENTSDRALANVVLKAIQAAASDGYLQIRAGLDTVTVMPPYAVIGTILAGSGVWAAPTTVYYRITATNATGETTGSVEVAVVVPLATDRVVLNWTLPASPGGTGIKVYRSTVQGVYTTPALRDGTLGWVTTFTDDGSAVGAGALPSANGTASGAPSYGTPPTMVAVHTTGLTIGNLAIGQSKAYWWNRLPPLGGVESQNPRFSDRWWVET